MTVSNAKIDIPMGPVETELAVREYIQRHYKDMINYFPSERITITLRTEDFKGYDILIEAKESGWAKDEC